MKDFTVIKQNGEKELFDPDKLRGSLKEAHAPDAAVEDIIDKIIADSEDGTTTTDIYRQAFDLLKEHRQSFAARYSLRQSLADLGPTGYPFENFVARIFEAQGYETTVGVQIDGRCTWHEIDVVAEKQDTLILVEAKFHNSRSIQSSLQTPLYVKARFNDLAENSYGEFDHEGKHVEHWLVTNTKFSKQAADYGECAGLKMIGWGHPEEGNLEDLITETNLQPVTALTTLSGSNKRELTKKGVVLCKTLRNERDKLEAIGFSKEQIANVMAEVDNLCTA